MYLDNPKNMEFNESRNLKVFSNPKAGVVVLATVSKDGSFKKEQLFTTKEIKAYLMPSSYQSINNNDIEINTNEIIVNSEFKRNWKMFKFLFKE